MESFVSNLFGSLSSHLQTLNKSLQQLNKRTRVTQTENNTGNPDVPSSNGNPDIHNHIGNLNKMIDAASKMNKENEEKNHAPIPEIQLV